MVSVCGSAREASAVLRNPFSEREYVAKGEGSDPAANAARSHSRRRKQMRRYAVANCLTRMWTLTYRGAGEHDPARVKKDIARFVKKLRAYRGGGLFPYLWVIEWHPGGHGLHVHLALTGFVHKAALEELWGRGFVNFSDRRTQAGKTMRGATLAAYLGKSLAGYLAKGAVGECDGSHFYEVGQGFTPKSESAVFEGSEDEVEGFMASQFGGEVPATVWRSWERSVEEAENGPPRDMPPVIAARWYGGGGDG